MNEENVKIRSGERLRRYLINLSQALEEAEKNFSGGSEARKVLEEAKRYFEDAKYYYDKEDYETGLVAASYAEGLLDALRMLGYTDFTWLRHIEEKKIFMGGTFDIIHPGHIRLFREASRLGKLYVVVARDENVKKFKGREPVNPEDWRLEIISSIRYVYKALLGDKTDPIKSIEILRPDIIFLGPDQAFDENYLRDELNKRGLGDIEIMRYSSRIGEYSSLGVIRKILSKYCIRPDQCR
jgi:FAD synthetase